MHPNQKEIADFTILNVKTLIAIFFICVHLSNQCHQRSYIINS